MALDINILKAELEERLDSLGEHLSQMDETLRQPEDDDTEEQATEVNSDEVLSRLSRSSRDELKRIRAALRRIEEGTYGCCLVCGQLIESRRLEAVPEAERCINCAKLDKH
jgi:RNA polymerase-binding transcription factor DksA